MVDGNDIWEALFGIMKGHVPDEMTEEVCEQLAASIATPSQRLDAATVERCAQAWSTIKREFGYLFKDGVEETYPEVRDLDEAIRALATDPHQHGGKGA